MKNKNTFHALRRMALLMALTMAGPGHAQTVPGAEVDGLSSKGSILLALESFDLDVLKQRGIDPKVAEYFREAPRFTSGTQPVTLYVNGAGRGLVEASFDGQGQLCFNRALIDKAGLVTPDKQFLLPGLCYDFKAVFAQTEVALRPGQAEVALVVPTAALRAPEADSTEYSGGGTAALLNYDLLAVNSQFGGKSNDYLSANTELGVNSHDWIVRSRQSYAVHDNKTNFQLLYTYGQHTFVDYKAILQVGQINIGSSVVAGSAVTGIQVMPEAALRNQNQGGATIEGIAQAPARVEVRQSGALIYSTVVPAGPFSLTNIPLLNGNTDLIVSVIGTSGARRTFTVPAASLGSVSQVAPGYSFALGKVRSFGTGSVDRHNDPMLVTGSGGWALNDANQLSAGVMLASGYQSVGWGLDSAIARGSSLSVRNVVSSATQESVRGAQFSMSVSSALSDKFSAGASATRQTVGYRDLQETTLVRNPVGTTPDLSSRAQAQYSASLSWSDRTLGGFSVSYANAKSGASNGASSQRVVGSWNKTFKQATVSVSIERDLSTNKAGADNAVYVNLSIPLGRRSVRTYLNNSGGKSRLGASLSEQVNEYVNYTVSTERKSREGEVDVSATAGLLPRYAQVNLGYARSASGGSAYSGQMRGGVALHKDGLTLSPYRIEDTFGVLTMGDVSGVRINTQNGPVWTDAWGRAVVPQLSAYRTSRLEVATKSLPRNVDIQNGFKKVGAGRGSVHYIKFGVVKVRRVLMTATTADGIPLPKGASVVGSQDEFLTTVVDGGKLFLSNGQLADGLRINLPDGKQCALDFALPEKPKVNVYFETINAVCRAPGQGP